MYWQPYADFEREKLKDLQNVKAAYCGFNGITLSCQDCYWVLLSRADCRDKKCNFPWQTLDGDRRGEKQHCHYYGSTSLTKYTPVDYCADSEYSRLLKRAEFLKAVCEKEGVGWLAKNEFKCDPSYLNIDIKLHFPCQCYAEQVHPGCLCVCHMIEEEPRTIIWYNSATGTCSHHIKGCSSCPTEAGAGHRPACNCGAVERSSLTCPVCKPETKQECCFCNGTRYRKHFNSFTLTKAVGKSPCLNCCQPSPPTEKDGSHAPECSGDDCDKLDGCPCICHEEKRKNYYTKAEIQEFYAELFDILAQHFNEHDIQYLKSRFL